MDQHQGPNLRSHNDNIRYRQRIGPDTQYRDNPNAPPDLYGSSAAAHHDNKKYAMGGGSGSSTASSFVNSCCSPYMCCSNLSSNNAGGKQPLSAEDEEGVNGRYYRDEFNDMSWTCNVGTTDEHGIWLNRSDPAGTIMAVLVWVLLGYSALTITLLAQTGGISIYLSYIYTLLCSLALSSHVKTTLTDPGSVPPSAVPTEEQQLLSNKLSMCSQCQTYKPPLSHHCRICNRCISKMDHHCPWMNNCVGAGNMKHFLLFLIYTWSCSCFSLSVLGWNYFFCAEDTCEFNLVLTQLVRIMTILSVGAFLFTSSMLMNVLYGLMTGIGTIDRLKKKATNTMSDSEEEPIPLTDVFGVSPIYTWFLPVDPVFDNYDKIMGYSTPQRLLREQIKREQQKNTLEQQSDDHNDTNALLGV